MLLGQLAVGEYVVDARSVVGVSRSGQCGPAGEGVGAIWVEMAKGVREPSAAAVMS